MFLARHLVKRRRITRRMCDQHQLHCTNLQGDIDHFHHLSQHIGALFENCDYSDVTLKVDGVLFKAHKVILAARSEYFRALLFGGLLETSREEIELKETKAVPFKYLLRYIYTGTMNLNDLKEETLLEVLGLVHQYGFVDLENAISDYLKAILMVRNVCFIYDLGIIYNLQSLTNTCLEYMDKHAQDILKTDAFFTLSENALYEVITRDSFCAKEIDIFKAVCSWKEQNANSDISKVLKAVRLPLMSIEDLLTDVRQRDIIPPDTILDAIKIQRDSRNTELNFRGYLVPEENLATSTHGAQVIKGEIKDALLDGDTTRYDLDRGFSRHAIDDQNEGIVISLARPSIINHIRLLLWDRDMRSYSYYIEVSMDESDWVRVVDHSKHLCRSWQKLYFPSRVVQYVKIVGTHNTVNRVFHVVAFECYYTDKTLPLKDGLVVPKDNIATIQASACVIEGVSRSRNALINGDKRNYDWDSGYTCHQLGSGSIVIQMAQPYIIGSMSLLLWDCDDRSYSYKIEVSTDQNNWHMVSDKTNVYCQSWQTISFPPRPVTFARIVGVVNTANEVFHCVHFECPVDPEVLLSTNNGHNESGQRQLPEAAPTALHPHNPNQYPVVNEEIDNDAGDMQQAQQ